MPTPADVIQNEIDKNNERCARLQEQIDRLTAESEQLEEAKKVVAGMKA